MDPSFSSAPAPPPPCRIVLVDDHAIVRTALRCLLETTAGIQVVAEAATGEEALARIAEYDPDVAVVDVAMPGMNGIEVMRRVASSGARTRVLALTAYEDGHHVRETLGAGAAGFVPKSAAAVELVAAILTVAAGRQHVHPGAMDAALKSLFHRQGQDKAELSLRETEVLHLLAKGFSTKETAARLAVGVKSVETYKARAMEKIGGSSRVDLVQFAVARGWLKA